MYKDKMIWLYVRGKQVLKDSCGEFGVGSILSIAVALIVSAFVLVPGMKGFADTVIKAMGTWWTGTIKDKVFPTAAPAANAVINYLWMMHG